MCKCKRKTVGENRHWPGGRANCTRGMISIKGVHAWSRGMFRRQRGQYTPYRETVVNKYHLNAKEDCRVLHTSKKREDGQCCVKATLKCSLKQLWINPQARGQRSAFQWKETDHNFLTAQQLVLCPKSTPSFLGVTTPSFCAVLVGPPSEDDSFLKAPSVRSLFSLPKWI